MKIAWAILISGIVISIVSISGILWCYLYKGTLKNSSKIKNENSNFNNKKIISKDIEQKKGDFEDSTVLLEEDDGTVLLEDDGTVLLEDSEETQLLD